jgi:hypothetical protein
LKRKKPMKKIARSQRTRLQVYFALSTEFLLKPENKFCLTCQVRREHGENILIQIATEVHHWAGRIGRLLCYVPFFRPSCRGCRDWPHTNATKAREWGLLAPAPLWNVFPGNGWVLPPIEYGFLTATPYGFQRASSEPSLSRATMISDCFGSGFGVAAGASYR